jgi:hypothetical protein
MFNKCNFLLGAGHSIIIVIPGNLPHAETYTVSVCDKNIRFKAGYDEIAAIDYPGGDLFERFANNTQIGLVEHDIAEALPANITNVAYVEIRRSV